MILGSFQYKIQMRFPSHHDSLVSFLSKPISSQLGSNILHFHELENQNRTLKRYKTQIRNMLGFRESTDDDSVDFIAWLVNNILAWLLKQSFLVTLFQYGYVSVNPIL